MRDLFSVQVQSQILFIYLLSVEQANEAPDGKPGLLIELLGQVVELWHQLIDLADDLVHHVGLKEACR